ncbi:MAG: DUF2169 domain-containing protein [Minicystis sp.]
MAGSETSIDARAALRDPPHGSEARCSRREATLSTPSHSWPVHVTAVGEAVCGTRTWTSRSQLRVTVVVKGTFAIVPGGEITPVAAAPLVVDDEHHGGHPAHSLRAAGELAAYLRRVDVLLTGHAHAPPGQAVTALTARLILGRDREVLVNKSIRVQGDWSEQTGELSALQHMPLIYERALGGPGSDENPAGVGLAGGRSPNLVDPRGRPVPACFAPIPRRWPVRARLLGDLDPGALEAKVPALPDTFDWAYFQAAPADQQIDKLRGDEVIVLEGMHPTLPRVETRLPGARALAKVYGPGPELVSGRPLALRADTLHIDTTGQTCTILWRGHFPAEGLDLDTLEVAAGIELPNRPLVWPWQEWQRRAPAADKAPDSVTVHLKEEEIAARFARPAAESAREPAAGLGGLKSTIRISAGDVARQLAAAGLPFDRPPQALDTTLEVPATSAARPSPKAALPFDREPPKTSARPGGATLELRPEDVARISPADALPFGREPPAQGYAETPAARGHGEAQASAAPARPSPAAGPPTVELRPEDVARISPADALPFERAPAARASDSPLEGTVELRAEDAARLLSGGALPFDHEPPARRSDAMPSAPPPMVSPPPAITPLPAIAPPLVAAPVISPPPLLGAPAEPPPSPAPSLAEPAPTDIRATVLARIASREPMLDLSLAGADLHGLDLTGAGLSRVDLTGAKLGGCKLAGAQLAGAQLAGAKLGGADLTGADLTGADLTGADLARAALAKARFDGAILTDAILTEARGPGASFAGATATRASFARGQWDEARFARVDAASADFHASSLQGARFEGATLGGARFDETRGAGAVLDGARLAQARAVGADLTGASLRDVDAPRSVWEKATLDRACFAGANLKDANLRRARCPEASFAGATLGGANLQHLAGAGADLREARLEGADLRQAKLEGGRFEGAVLRDASAGRAELARCRLDRADLAGASLRGARLVGASFAYAKLEGTDLQDADLEGVNVFGASRKTAKLSAGARGLVEIDPGEDPARSGSA